MKLRVKMKSLQVTRKRAGLDLEKRLGELSERDRAE